MRSPTQTLSYALEHGTDEDRVDVLASIAANPNLFPRFAHAVAPNAAHDSAKVRAWALTAAEAASMPGLPTLEAAVRAKRSATECRRAIHSIGRLGVAGAPALEAVLDALASEHAEVREAAAFVLPALGSESIKPLARRVHRSDDRNEVVAAADALARQGRAAEEVEIILWNGTRSEDEAIALACTASWIAVTEKTSRGWKNLLKVLTRALSHDDPTIRRLAITRIRDLRTLASPCADALSKVAAHDGDPELRALALQALVAVEATREQRTTVAFNALEDDSAVVRRAAVLTLSTVRSGSLRTPLARASADPDSTVARLARAVLTQLSPEGDDDAHIETRPARQAS